MMGSKETGSTPDRGQRTVGVERHLAVAPDGCTYWKTVSGNWFVQRYASRSPRVLSLHVERRLEQRAKERRV